MDIVRFSDGKYYEIDPIPAGAQAFMEERDMPFPDQFSRGSAGPPFYSESARAIVFGEDLSPELAERLGVPFNIGCILKEKWASRKAELASINRTEPATLEATQALVRKMEEELTLARQQGAIALDHFVDSDQS